MALSNAERSTNYRTRHPERVAASKRRYRQMNLTKIRRDDAERQRKLRALGKDWNTEHPAQMRENTKQWRHSFKGNVDTLYRNARNRAHKEGVEFSLTREWISERLRPMRCEVTGVQLHHKTTEDKQYTMPWSPSLDRRNNKLGYTPDNTRVVCWMYNRAKGEHTDIDVLTMAESLVQQGTA